MAAGTSGCEIITISKNICIPQGVKVYSFFRNNRPEIEGHTAGAE
jgi:hypothetical protein